MSAQAVDDTVDRVPHGRASGYCYWKCRCIACREWNATMSRTARDRQRPDMPPECGYDTLGRRVSRKPRLRVRYQLTGQALEALGCGYKLTDDGHTALGGRS
jgi:hypothetical protein